MHAYEHFRNDVVYQIAHHDVSLHRCAGSQHRGDLAAHRKLQGTITDRMSTRYPTTADAILVCIRVCCQPALHIRLASFEQCVLHARTNPLALSFVPDVLQLRACGVCTKLRAPFACDVCVSRASDAILSRVEAMDRRGCGTASTAAGTEARVLCMRWLTCCVVVLGGCNDVSADAIVTSASIVPSIHACPHLCETLWKAGVCTSAHNHC